MRSKGIGIPWFLCGVSAFAGLVRGGNLIITSRFASDNVTASPSHSNTDILIDAFADKFSYIDPGGSYSAGVNGVSGSLGTSVYSYSASGSTSATSAGAAESVFGDAVHFTVNQTTAFTLTGSLNAPIENAPISPAGIRLQSETAGSKFTAIADFQNGDFNYSGILSSSENYFFSLNDDAYAGGLTGVSAAFFSANAVLSVPEPVSLSLIAIAGLGLLRRRRVSRV